MFARPRTTKSPTATPTDVRPLGRRRWFARSRLIAGWLGAFVLAPQSAVYAGEDSPARAVVPNSVIAGIAQKFVRQQYEKPSSQVDRVTFDETEILPQEGGKNWGAVGGFMLFVGGQRPQPHAFGLSMRLVCPRREDITCWRLEKLLIDQQLIVNE